MSKTIKSVEKPTMEIEGYKVTIRVTDKTLNLAEVLDDLLGRKLEKVTRLSINVHCYEIMLGKTTLLS